MIWARSSSVGGEGMQRELRQVELGGDVGGGAEVGEVGGEAVAEIDAGGGEAAAQEGLADGEARLREEVGVMGVGGCGTEFAWGGSRARRVRLRRRRERR